MKMYNKRYQMLEIFGVFLVDLFTIALSCAISRILRIVLPFGTSISKETDWIAFYLLCVLGCLLYHLLFRRYGNLFNRGYLVEMEEVLKYQVFLFAMLSTFVYFLRLEVVLSRLLLVYFIFVNIFFTYIFRTVFKLYIRRFYKGSRDSDKVLVVTTLADSDKVLQQILRDDQWSYEVVGLAIVDSDEQGKTLNGQSVVANRDNLIDVARQMTVDQVFFYCPQEGSVLQQWIQAFVVMGVKCYHCVQGITQEVPYSGIGDFADFPVLCYGMPEWDFRRIVIKRAMDIVGGMIGLIITIVVLPFIAIAIKIDDPHGPIFFSQMRVGKNGRRFKLYKFRSMCADAEQKKNELMAQNEMKGLMFKMQDDPRVTRVGKFLRKTSLDELPQFWNILKGDMSLVGTRPPTVEEFEQYNDYYRRRLSITPGLTGLWQVSGRSEIKDFEEIVKMDLKYIDGWSIKEDIKILIRTVRTVAKGKGAN